ncbi:MAG TPA: NAD+ synthase [Saprospiraceae bacterium]|nr:NAD+ synthase [Saprospiraceae bacterium]
MKIALAQLNYHIGNFEGNTQKIIEAITEAKSNGADIICFGELATTGYPPRDFLEFDDFIHLAEKSIDKIMDYSQDIAIVLGSPSRNPILDGKDLFNSVYFLYQGEVKYIQHKTLLPTYDIFDEYRYFEPAFEWSIVEFKGQRIALTVCEDIWDISDGNPLYKTVPLDEMQPQKPDFIINVSASPFSYAQANKRLKVVMDNVKRYGIPLFYVNHVGAQTEIIFDGGSIAMSPDGSFIEMPYFEEKISYFDLEKAKNSFTTQEQPKEKISLIHDALVEGVKNYFNKLGFTDAILGLSGGIDSAVTLVLAAEALGAGHVRVLLMPSQFSSDHSINDAVLLAQNLGVKYDIIPIQSIYSQFMDELKPLFENKPFNVTEENIQARIRGILNMAVSNKFGNILLNTTNKSEMAVGYGTLYGDLCGGLSVIGDVYKTEVYELANFINRKTEIIPINTIVKPPSAELRPNQKDSDSLPDYDILDKILFHYIEECTDPQDIIDMGYDEALVKRILRLVNINEFKRHQTAPVLRVSPKAFGMGRRMPIVAKYLS